VAMPMSNLPANDRPRERLTANGAGALADRELLALLLGTGGSTGTGAHELAERLLGRFGSVGAIGTATFAELCALKGVGVAKASGLVAGFELARRATGSGRPMRLDSTADIARLAAPMLRNRSRERLLVVSCDSGSRVLGVDLASEGGADQTLFPVREIIVAVLRRDGRRFALAHNHPGGDPTPSRGWRPRNGVKVRT